MAYRGKSKFKTFPSKSKHQHKIEAGMSGFLCTCNGKFREKDCLRESYIVLNEFADELFGSQDVMCDTEMKPPTESPESSVNPQEAGIETLLAAEVKSMREEGKKKDSRRFQVVESGANGIVFIKTTVPDPVKLAHTIVSTYAKGIQKSKFLLRLLPVETTCKAYIDEISTAIQPLLDKYFTGEGKTFAIVYNHRNNDSLKREELIEKLADLVSQKNVLHKADLKQPELVILLEVIRSVCCISVVPDYYSLKKYNLMENALKSNENKDTNENSQEADDSKTSQEAEGDSKTSQEAEDDSKNSQEAEDDSKNSQKEEDDSKTSQKAEDDSKNSQKAEDDSKTSQKAEDDSKNSQKAEDDSENGQGDGANNAAGSTNE